MVNVPITFPVPTETAIASYNFTDIADGTGFVTYYGWATEDSTGKDYVLVTDSNLRSDDIEQQVTLTNGAAFVKEFDLDFDTSSLNLPRTLVGVAHFNTPIELSAVGESAYVIAKLRKWDGTTETDIASVQSETYLDGAGGVEKTLAFSLTVPLTHFKKGETIRITLEYWAKGVGEFGIGQDPANRDGTLMTDNTQIKINLPFKLDL